MMASMRNGQGNNYFILFFNDGAAIKGFDIDAPINEVTDKDFWKNKIKQIPNQYDQFLREPAFITNEATFFIWRLSDDFEWHTLNLGVEAKGKMANIYDFDGSQNLISILCGLPKTYKRWADAYYESDFDLNIIEKIYIHEPLTKDMVKILNSDIDYEALIEDTEEIGYPCNITLS
jgi:hypothetical protein